MEWVKVIIIAWLFLVIKEKKLCIGSIIYLGFFNTCKNLVMFRVTFVQQKFSYFNGRQNKFVYSLSL